MAAAGSHSLSMRALDVEKAHAQPARSVEVCAAGVRPAVQDTKFGPCGPCGPRGTNCLNITKN